MQDRRLPAFIVIGAVKAATTWIAHQLRSHPQLFLPGPEPHYFSTEYQRGLDWYRSLFDEAPAGALIGEKSADYLAHPEAAARIAATLPHARLIVQLRNPVDRAYSDYCMLLRRGSVSSDPARYLLGKDPKAARFLEDGLYARHLARYLDRFPREQIAVILHDEIVEQPEPVIAAVCAHIGVAPAIAPAAVAARKNDGEAPILPLRLRQVLRPLKNAVRPLRGSRAFEAARATLARTPDYPPLTAGVRSRLEDYYHADVEKLGGMIGRDLSGWLERSPEPRAG